MKQLLVGLVSAATSGVAGLVDDLWVFFDRNRQALHDKVVSTVVVYASSGLPESLPAPHVIASARPPGRVRTTAEELRELAKLREEGILTEDEYEAKRRELADKL